MQSALADEERILPVECGFNFRDFGGYPTEDGGHVRRGMLYRSGVMAYVEEEGRARLTRLGIAAICDLRSSRERERRPTRWHEALPVELWARDYGDTAADLIKAVETGVSDEADMRGRMLRLYEGIAYEHAPSYRALFALLGAGKVPLVVNCSAGKDRTGTAVALVLSALGVARETILADYLLTGRADFAYLLNRSRRSQARALPADALRPLFAADPDYLATMFDSLERRSGSLSAYLERELGIGPAERRRLREQLVET